MAAGSRSAGQHAHIVAAPRQRCRRARHQHRPPIGIVARAQDQLDARPRHRFDQHAVELELRAAPWRCRRGALCQPSRKRRLIGKPEHDAAGIALVARAPRFAPSAPPDSRCARPPIARRSGHVTNSARGNRNARLRQQSLGGVLRDHAGRQPLARRARSARRDAGCGAPQARPAAPARAAPARASGKTARRDLRKPDDDLGRDLCSPRPSSRIPPASAGRHSASASMIGPILRWLWVGLLSTTASTRLP